MKFKIENHEKVLAAIKSKGYDESEYFINKKENTISIELYDANDLLEIGKEMGYEQYHERPEEFWLPNRNAAILKQAIKNTAQETRMVIDGFTFTERQPNDKYTKITVAPTKGSMLFNIYMEYGKLITQEEMQMDIDEYHNALEAILKTGFYNTEAGTAAVELINRRNKK